MKSDMGWLSFPSSLTQTLSVSTFVGEIIFTIVIILLGLLLFAFLIGNMQVYYSSLTHISVHVFFLPSFYDDVKFCTFGFWGASTEMLTC